MKKYLFLIALIFCFAPHAFAACGNGYSFCRTVTTDHTKDGSSTTANFAMLISGTYSYLATVGNSGKVQNTTTETGGAGITVPADLVFTSDAACTTKLNWEFETYNSATGAVNIWVNIGTLSNSADVVIYECYGNSSVTGWQGSVSGTWDTNYKAVYHLPDGSSLSVNDSTSNANNGTKVGSPAAATGQIDGASSFTYTNPDSIDLGSNSSLDVASGQYTVSVWGKWTTSTVPSGQNEMGIFQSGNFTNAWGLTSSFNDSSKLGVVYGPTSGFATWDFGYTNVVNDGNWHYFVIIGNGTSQPTLYVDGSVAGGSGTSLGFQATGTALGAGHSPFGGSLDEARVSNTNRSSSQITAEYNNQSAPSTFYTVGTEQTGSVIRFLWTQLLGRLTLLGGRLTIYIR